MSYNKSTVERVIKELNRQYFLPAIQREYVWEPDQIVTLMDSIMRGYPIGTFLFWEVQPNHYNDHAVYHFIKNYHPLNPHNAPQPNIDGVNNLYLVLDGQQRLTSLYIALCGSYTEKKRYARKTYSDSYITKQLYINLLKDGSIQSQNEKVEIDVTYDFRFWNEDEVPESDMEQYWYKVSRILQHDENKHRDFVEEEGDNLADAGIDRTHVRTFKKNLRLLYDVIRGQDLINYFLETEQDLDRVLDIFARTNMGGTKLSKSDLLLSMVTAKWGDMNAREEIHQFVDHINTDLTRKNKFDKDFVLKTALVVSDLPVKYQVENFNNANLERIRNNWLGIKQAMEKAVDLVNQFGIDGDNLTSVNSLIPIIYYIYMHPAIDVRGSKSEERRSAQSIHQWLITALMNRVFGAASDTMLTAVRKVLQEQRTVLEFPIDALNAEIFRLRPGSDSRAFIDNVLEIEYADTDAFFALSLLYDEKNWGTMKYHKDHIFPSDTFKPRNLKKAGFDDDKIARFQLLYNRIGNLQLLLDRENTSKSNDDFERWLSKRDSNFTSRHLIPTDKNLLKLENFEEFLTAREQLIRQRLNTLFAPYTEPI